MAEAPGPWPGRFLLSMKAMQDEEERHPRELHVDILVALHLRLLVELVVEVGEGQSAAVVAAELAAQKAVQRLSMLL